MGYTSPPRPNGIITLPEGTTLQAAELIRRDIEPQLMALYRAYDAYPRMTVVRPTDYHRYRNDLYGPPTRDWLPFLNGALLASAAALLVDVALMLGGII